MGLVICDTCIESLPSNLGKLVNKKGIQMPRAECSVCGQWQPYSQAHISTCERRGQTTLEAILEYLEEVENEIEITKAN